MSRHWVLENGWVYYAGSRQVTNEIEESFKYGTQELAEEFKTRNPDFSDFAAVEYEVTYTKVGR